MRPIEVYVDSTSGYLQHPDRAGDQGITVIPTAVTWPLETPQTFLENQLTDEIYDKLTAQVKPHTAGTFDEFLKPIVRSLNNGRNVLTITLTRAESGVHDVALTAATQALRDARQGQVTVFDSRTTSMPLIWMAESAARMAGYKKNLNEINETLIRQRTNFGLYTYISDSGMEAMLHNGRGKEIIAATLAKLLRVHPVIGFNESGKIYLVGQGRTVNKTLDMMTAKVLETTNLKRIGVVHTGDQDLAGRVIDDIRQKTRGSDIEVEDLGFAGYVLKAQAGTGSIAIGFETK
jgi:DegV family protein with EDD domain